MKELEDRQRKKARKPTFRTQDAHKKASLQPRWRKPRGRQSKMRLHHRGYNRNPSVGFSSSEAAYGRDPKGFLPVVVATAAQLERVGKGEGAVFASTLGKRRKAELLKLAIEKKIKVLNVKDAAAALTAIDASLRQRKSEKEKRDAKRAAKKADAKKAEAKTLDAKAAEPAVADPAAGEEKVDAEKKEKEKILTKKV